MGILPASVTSQDPAVSHHDEIQVNGLSLHLHVGDGAQWPADGTTLQLIRISLGILHDITKSATSDDLAFSINYSSVCSGIVATLSSRQFDSMEELQEVIFASIFEQHQDISEVSVSAAKVKGPLHSDSVTISSRRTRNRTSVGHNSYVITGIRCDVIIGVNDMERKEEQTVLFDIVVRHSAEKSRSFDFRGLTNCIYHAVKQTSYLTLETLASFVALKTLQFTNCEDDIVTITARKPNALAIAESAQIEIHRSQRDYPDAFQRSPPRVMYLGQDTSGLAGLLSAVTAKDRREQLSHVCAIALGSNLGDRFGNIESALRLLEKPSQFLTTVQSAEVAIIDTSFMYETTPMYVTDQPLFINCACLVETNLTPRRLLTLLKKIEVVVGRVPSLRNGPRAVDLDILTYDDDIIDTRPDEQKAQRDFEHLSGQLVIPHPRMAEREFVLRPLSDMIPSYVHPIYKQPIRKLLQSLLRTPSVSEFPMHKVIPFPRYPFVHPAENSSLALNVPPTAKYWKFKSSSMTSVKDLSFRNKTHIMATLNATPDSFSDGSLNNTLPAALSYAATSVISGADIIDIGGYSTRPGAQYVSPEEETGRVVPIIQAIRSYGDDKGQVKDVLISVDTFRWDVAEAAVLAGANCINDVCAFTGPEYPLTQASAEHFLKMREVARKLAVPVVLMHSRGDAGSNKNYEKFSSPHSKSGISEDAVVAGVRAELGERAEAIVKGRNGIRRWLVIVDPGIGFSKTVEGNLALLKNASSLTADDDNNILAGYPQLIGSSKKSFLGLILEQPDPEGSYRGRKAAPQDRDWATAATVSCAVQQGATIVRVHDVPQMRDVVAVASAIYR